MLLVNAHARLQPVQLADLPSITEELFMKKKKIPKPIVTDVERDRERLATLLGRLLAR